MGSVVTLCRTPDADVDAIISADWAVVERERETHADSDRRRCSDQSAVCKLIGKNGLASHLDACIMYVLPFVVHRVTWDAWPYKQGQYAACPPTSWGHCKRECSPAGEGKKRTCSQAGELVKVCRSMFAAVINCGEPPTKQFLMCG